MLGSWQGSNSDLQSSKQMRWTPHHHRGIRKKLHIGLDVMENIASQMDTYFSGKMKKIHLDKVIDLKYFVHKLTQLAS